VGRIDGRLAGVGEEAPRDLGQPRGRQAAQVVLQQQLAVAVARRQLSADVGGQAFLEQRQGQARAGHHAVVADAGVLRVVEMEQLVRHQDVQRRAFEQQRVHREGQHGRAVRAHAALGVEAGRQHELHRRLRVGVGEQRAQARHLRGEDRLQRPRRRRDPRRDRRIGREPRLQQAPLARLPVGMLAPLPHHHGVQVAVGRLDQAIPQRQLLREGAPLRGLPEALEGGGDRRRRGARGRRQREDAREQRGPCEPRPAAFRPACPHRSLSPRAPGQAW